jgi:Xaa-Pro aminopeptidase
MFRAHRERFLAKLPPDAIAVIRSAPTRVFSNDTDYVYRQDSDFYYLTGLEEPDAVALFKGSAADGKRYVLFVRGHDARRESFEGRRAGPEGAVSEFGADAGFPVDEFLKGLTRFDPATRSFSGHLAGVQKVYLSDGGDSAWAQKFRETLDGMRARDAGPATMVDARELLHELRLVKDADEIALLRRAAAISARGHALAMKATAPGRYEFEVQQALDAYCHANGARNMAYPSIVASGPDSVFLHWEKNNRQMKDGEVLLNDSGAEYGSYASDVTRTYPVNGRFSAEQRRIYEIVLAAQKAAMALVKPGLLHEEIEKTSARIQTEGLVRLGLLSGNVDTLIKDNAQRKFTLHGVSHWVGRARRRGIPGRRRLPRARARNGLHDRTRHLHRRRHARRRPQMVEHRRSHRRHRPRDEGRLRLPVLRCPSRNRRRRARRPREIAVSAPSVIPRSEATKNCPADDREQILRCAQDDRVGDLRR